ncbi:MAG TPA: VWA domain-containing protein, partial [Bdellovibrionota bacterium]|nr:VWA domain-containing protein [Bdellovibrionota bacterium]
FNTEAYDLIKDNEFKLATQDSLSTFSIDVDTASYSNLRRFLTGGQLPPKDSVRIEELVNYFPYNYAGPTGPDPFAVNVEISQAPWNKEHRLVRIGLKGKVIENSKRPSSNLVFLVDVSGSMQDANKLPWVKQSLKMLVDQLGENDRIAIAVYAGAAGLALQPTRGNDKATILGAIDRLEAGGSTNGAQGIELAYRTAASGFIKGGTNRVILLTDGDFNVGVTGQGDLARLAEEKSKSGVFLSVLGFGMGNLKDSTMEKIADKGRGHYAYIDSLNEARKVFVEEMGANLVTIAKDVKIQVEFNPAEVNAFRLIGYENRVMQHQEFNDDKKFAGIIGAGHTVTALYEIVPKGKSVNVPGVDALKYQKPAAPKVEASKSGELMTLKLRYKEPEGEASKLLTFPIKDEGRKLEQATKDLRFQASVAGFGMLLRDSPFKGTITWEEVLDLAQTGRGEDRHGYRGEFIELVKKARDLSNQPPAIGGQR